MTSLPDTGPNNAVATSLKQESDQIPNAHPPTPPGLHLQIDFSYRKFKNLVSEKANNTLTPLYAQRFGVLKPQLKYDALAPDGTAPTSIGTGTIMNVSISAECTLHGETIDLKPLKRWKTQYNYLSRAFSHSDNGNPVPITWVTETSLKIWDWVCINSATQEPIAKMSVNLWALKQVGNFYFEKTKEELGQWKRDEVVVTGLTLLYVMISRINNPLNLVGSMVAKPGKAEGGIETKGVALTVGQHDQAKGKSV